MANVFQLRQTTVESSPRSPIQCQLDAYLLALAESKLAVEVGKAQIEKDIGVLESVMWSMDPHLRELFQQQLAEIKSQLALAELKLTSAKHLLLDASGAILMAASGCSHQIRGRRVQN